MYMYMYLCENIYITNICVCVYIRRPYNIYSCVYVFVCLYKHTRIQVQTHTRVWVYVIVSSMKLSYTCLLSKVSFLT